MTDSVSRRTVVRTAAHAAWVAPAVVVVSAVPAFAATGPAALSIVVTNATKGPAGALSQYSVNLFSTITNANTEASTALQATIVVTLDAAAQWGALVTGSATGYSPAVVTGTGVTRTFVFVATAQVAGNATKAFNAVLATGSTTFPTGTSTLTASPGATGTPGSTNQNI